MKKPNKINYDGLSKDQIRQLKKEKRQRREWNKYRDKLLKERDEVTKQFHNSYYWNSFTPVNVNKGSVVNQKRGSNYQTNTVGVMSPIYLTKSSGMHQRRNEESPRDPSPEPMDDQLTKANYVHLQDVI